MRWRKEPRHPNTESLARRVQGAAREGVGDDTLHNGPWSWRLECSLSSRMLKMSLAVRFDMILLLRFSFPFFSLLCARVFVCDNKFLVFFFDKDFNLPPCYGESRGEESTKGTKGRGALQVYVKDEEDEEGKEDRK